MCFGELAEQIPFDRARLEGIEDEIAARGITKLADIAAVGISDDRAIPTCERPAEQLADRRALAGARGADEFEVLGLIGSIERDSGERKRTGAGAVADSALSSATAGPCLRL